MEERDPDLEWEEYFNIYNYREDHWKEVEEENNEYRGRFHALRWELYMK